VGGSFLDRIVAERRADAAARREQGALELAKAAAQAAPSARDLAGALASPGVSLVAEVKRASPSAGTIASIVEPAPTARAYEAGGAAAISVLTEPAHFGGSLEDLRSVRDAVDLPVLRKDFLCDPLHLWEARGAGADAVLLIVAAVSQSELVGLLDLAGMLGMTALVEIHEPGEADRALAAGARVVGINARNLATLEVDADAIKRIRPLLPAGVLVVAESGIATRADVEALEFLEVDAILVGEALMRAPDPEAKIRELLGRERSE
jgi:indole-3-glycerol phosphate synthase